MLKINDPRILEIPVIESNEPMINLLEIGNFLLWSQIPNLKEKSDFEDCKYPFVRISVAHKFKEVFQNLPKGWGLYLCDAYRNYSFQKQLFLGQVNKLKEKHPEWEIARLEREASVFVSNPDIYSPHVTGGAVDIALVNETKAMVDVGNWFDYDESAYTDFQGLNEEQNKNRQMLIQVMTKTGFVNYPYEWWHWSYGDRYWGFMTGNKAIYGEIDY